MQRNRSELFEPENKAGFMSDRFKSKENIFGSTVFKQKVNSKKAENVRHKNTANYEYYGTTTDR